MIIANSDLCFKYFENFTMDQNKNLAHQILLLFFWNHTQLTMLFPMISFESVLLCYLFLIKNYEYTEVFEFGVQFYMYYAI